MTPEGLGEQLTVNKKCKTPNAGRTQAKLQPQTAIALSLAQAGQTAEGEPECPKYGVVVPSPSNITIGTGVVVSFEYRA
jgi:hypothetical protein